MANTINAKPSMIPCSKVTLLALGSLASVWFTACSNERVRNEAPTAPKPALAFGGSRLAAKPPASAGAANTRDADQRFNSALELMKSKQPKDAQIAFIALSKDFPEFSGPLTALGILYAQGKQRDEALTSFAKAAAANPGNAVAWNWLGSLYRENNDLHRAEDAYRKAIGARGDYAAAHLNLGILYDVSLHRPQDAIAEYREYQRLTSGDNLIVGVWIKELETGSAQRTASAQGAQ